MTSKTTSNQPPQTASSAFARPANPAALPALKQTPRSFPRQSLSEPDAIPATLSSAAEPLVKRQKLDNEPYQSRSEAHVKFAAPHYLRATTTSAEHAPDDKSKEGVLWQTTTASSQSRTRVRRSGSPLLPLRPGPKPANGGPSRANSSAAQRVVSRGSVQNKPYVVESPPSAPRFKHDGSADFHPWTGHHPEDVLNETTTKNGSYDKPHVPQNETSTARHAVWSSLKHKSGIQVLSSLFVLALDQRQAHGTVTASCTFKPPPRVTLTDTKREIWLRDLANPDIPLRRLSRTIPHGIRGKVLLDQCLAKAIPTSRAVWLAKCVGANEIRAFKRKGAGGAFAVSGESKWIKDWTSNVEQFIETIIGTCGSLEWRSRIDYGLRLASHLSSEHLLDQDHYLSWVLSSLQNCELDNLPIWLLVMQIHRDELLEQRQRGRRLVEALLEQLHKAVDAPNGDVYGPVIQQLVNTLKSFMISDPTCFLMPRLWHKYESILRKYIEGDEHVVHDCFEHISIRNLRLMQVLRVNIWRPPNTPRQRIIAVLDNMPTDSNFVRLANDCLQIMDDFDGLVATCLEWASSLHRDGYERIYISARLLRQCGKARGGLETSVMKFLAANSGLVGLSCARLYRILAELLRSNHLTPGKYLSWLMARGNLHGPPTPDQDGPCDARLLLEMPLLGVPPHVSNLRQILLSRIGVSVKDEDHAITFLKTEIDRKVPDFFSLPEESASLKPQAQGTARSSVTVKLAVASWIRQTVAARFSLKHVKHAVKPEETVPQEEAGHGSPPKAMTPNQFQGIRKVLEDLGDFAILADVLHIVSDSEDGSILTAACDTVSYHFNIFAAIGAHVSLFNDLCQRYEDIRSSKAIDVSLVESLIDLGKCLPNTAKQLKRLRRQALLYLQKSPAIACSPISDTMAEALQSGESTFAEEIEQVLASGTSMDRQTLARLFEAIIKRLEASWTNLAQSVAVFAELLIRLRRFGRKQFDSLIHTWVGHVLRNLDRPTFREIFVPLICSGCLTLETLLGLAAGALDELDVASARAALAVDMLELLALISSAEGLSTVQKGYRPRLQYDRAVRRRPIATTPFLRATLHACSGTQSQTQVQACAVLRRPEVQVLLNDLSIYDPQGLNELNRSLGAWTLLDDFHVTSKDEGLSHENVERKLVHILGHVNDFNIPLCHSELEAVLAEAISKSVNPATILVTVLKKLSPIDAASRSLLSSLITGLPAYQAIQVRHHAESEILSRAVCDQNPIDAMARELIDPLLSVVEACVDGNSDQAMFSAVAQIGEKLNVLLSSQRFTMDQLNPGYLHTTGDGSHPPLDDFYELHVLLRLLTVHQTTTQHPRFPQATLYQILMSLSIFLIHPSMTKHSSLTAYIQDILSLLSDSLSEESRSRCIRTLRDHHHTRDLRLLFVFGYPEVAEEEWLHLVTSSPVGPEAKPTETAGPTSKPATLLFSLRRWEMMQDATPVMGENDTSLSLTLFGAQKSVL